MKRGIQFCFPSMPAPGKMQHWMEGRGQPPSRLLLAHSYAGALAALAACSGVQARLMENAWMSCIKPPTAAFTSLCLSSSRLPSNAGDTTATSKLLPHLESSVRCHAWNNMPGWQDRAAVWQAGGFRSTRPSPRQYGPDQLATAWRAICPYPEVQGAHAIPHPPEMSVTCTRASVSPVVMAVSTSWALTMGAPDPCVFNRAAGARSSANGHRDCHRQHVLSMQNSIRTVDPSARSGGCDRVQACDDRM